MEAASAEQDQVVTHTQHTLRCMHYTVTGRRKLCRALPSSRSIKLTPDILCLIVSQTVPQEVIHSRHPGTRSE